MGNIRIYVSLFFILIEKISKISSENVILQGRYNFNHPPSVDDYDPLLLIVSYNDDASAEGRSNIDLIYSNEELSPANSSTKKQSNHERRSRSLNEKKIPIYFNETEDNTNSDVESLAEKSENTTAGQTHRQQKELPFEKERTFANIIPSKKQKVSRQRDPVVPILESENYLYSFRGDYRYGYESGDGTKAFGKGELKTFSDNTTGEAVEGSFSYKDKDGEHYSLSYTADENGYQPVGAHLPTPPPLPPAIERALRYLATKTIPDSATEKF